MELLVKTSMLGEFLGSDKNLVDIDKEDIELLHAQFSTMSHYIVILKKRIVRFMK